MPLAPTPPPPELVVCDLAGTTVYDRGEVPAAFADALREAAVPFDPAEITAWRGASKREVIGRLLGRDGAPADAVAERLPLVYGRFRSTPGSISKPPGTPAPGGASACSPAHTIARRWRQPRTLISSTRSATCRHSGPGNDAQAVVRTLSTGGVRRVCSTTQ